MKYVHCVLIIIMMCGAWVHAGGCYCHEYPWGHSPGDLIRNVGIDFLDVHRHIFTANSMRVLSGFVPIYIGARLIDEPTHNSFYDYEFHANKDEPCEHLYTLTNGHMSYPIIVLSAMLFASSCQRTRVAVGTVIPGIMAVLFTKDLLKDCCAGRRPYNEHYRCDTWVYNGWPSGHATGISFLAVYYGLTQGARWMIPAGIVAGLLSGLAVQCNKHYVSQVVAGLALGTTYAFATYAVYKKRVCSMERELCCSLQARPNRQIGFELAYRY